MYKRWIIKNKNKWKNYLKQIKENKKYIKKYGKEKRKIIDCHYERNGVHYKNMYDENWEESLDYIFGFKSDGRKVEKPKKLNKILNVCDRLSEDTNYVRVDLYYIKGKIYRGWNYKR